MHNLREAEKKSLLGLGPKSGLCMTKPDFCTGSDKDPNVKSVVIKPVVRGYFCTLKLCISYILKT